jgi:hypothetical protein
MATARGDRLGFIDYPPPLHPDYERESMDALDGWQLERCLAELDREIDQLEGQVGDCEGDLRFAEAEQLVAIMDQKQAEFRALKQQLDKLCERGLW